MSIARFIRSSLAALFATAAATTAVAGGSPAQLRAFTAQSFAAVRAANAGRPVVIAFWSVSCEPCHREIALLAKLHRAYPQVRIVLVAADAPELRPAVLRFLGRHDVSDIERWQFDNQPEERLRFSVDHAWRGELPRAYFIAANGESTVHSGVPDDAWATAWFARAAATQSAKSR